MTDRHFSDPDMTADEALALDLVLGVLRAPDRSQAERRSLSDPAFAALVAGHRKRLFPAGERSTGEPLREQQPRDSTWDAIKARLRSSPKG